MNIPCILFSFISCCIVTTAAIDCSGVKLVATVSDKTKDCIGYDTLPEGHLWPVGVEASYCHGWQGTDPNDKVHDNSANNIRCSSDGTKLLYTQFADTLNCQNEVNEGGTEKYFELNVCHEGIPPVLFDMAVNMDCCLFPGGDSCMNNFTGIPNIPRDGQMSDISIWWNGEECDAKNERKTPTGKPTPTGKWKRSKVGKNGKKKKSKKRGD